MEMKEKDRHNKRFNRFSYTPEQRERYMKELSAIYYRCLMGKASRQELRIAEKFTPALIEKLKEHSFIEKAALPEADREQEDADMKQMWERVAAKLDMTQDLLPAEEHQFTDADYQNAYMAQLKEGGKQKSLLRTAYRYTAVAAMIALVVGLGYFFNKDVLNSADGVAGDAMIACAATTTSQLKKIELPDGTQVELNRESTLKLSKAFGKAKREVEMKGQLFFNVAKDASRPFVINASGIDVTVRGTSFEVMSYDEIPEREVTVRTGRVEVRNSHDGKLLATLTKGMQLIFTPGAGAPQINTVDADVVTAWQDGKLILHNASLPELRLRLRQYFGKTLVIQDNALKADLRFSTSFNYEEATLDNVMTRLCALFNVQNKIDGNRIIVSPANNI